MRRTDALVPPVEVGRGGQVVGDGEGESSAEDTGEVNRVALEERPVEKLEGARSERANGTERAGGGPRTNERGASVSGEGRQSAQSQLVLDK